MKFLQEIQNLKEVEDLSALPKDKFDELQDLIKSGAKNSGEWPNALALVHRVYDASKIQRPTPAMRAGWDQYNELISLAVKELSNEHGIDGNWRMISSSLKEDTDYNVQLLKNEGLIDSYSVNSSDLESIIENLTNTFENPIKIKTKEEDTKTILEFWSYDVVKSPYRIIIET